MSSFKFFNKTTSNSLVKLYTRANYFVWSKIKVKKGVCVCFAAKKTKKQVFVSYSLPMTDSNLSLLVENRIKKELELHPEHF